MPISITKSTQIWVPGQAVKVGFLSLVVVEMVPTPGDGLPDAYILSSMDKRRTYRFVPHNGLERLD